MRRFDLTPLLRTSVGFDDLFGLADSRTAFNDDGGFPPYNIERVSDDDYRIEMAVAGFAPEELDVQVQENTLTIAGQAAQAEGDRTYLHRGIAKRAFERNFRLADSIRVSGARFENGLLIVDLVREVPEHKRPRRIEINSAGETGSARISGDTDLTAEAA